MPNNKAVVEQMSSSAEGQVVKRLQAIAGRCFGADRRFLCDLAARLPDEASILQRERERVREALWGVAKEVERQGDRARSGPTKDLRWAEAAAIREAATKALSGEAGR